jgi:chromosome segregation ATPase
LIAYVPHQKPKDKDTRTRRGKDFEGSRKVLLDLICGIRQIYRLKTSLTTLDARTSHLHVRLLETLNTLDCIQSVHSEELDTLAREKFELEQKLRMLQLQLDEATDERDDMRDAVERLVEKGSICSSLLVF